MAGVPKGTGTLYYLRCEPSRFHGWTVSGLSEDPTRHHAVATWFGIMEKRQGGETPHRKERDRQMTTEVTQGLTPKATASGIPVWCSFDELRDIASLVPFPRNPNTHPDKQIALLAKIIGIHGWRSPITVSKRSGYITKGHGRLQAARMLNVELVPIDLQDYENEATEYADILADNKIAELAVRDKDLVKEMLSSLDNIGFDLELAGFDPDDQEHELAPKVEKMPIKKMELKSFEHHDYLVFVFKDSRDFLNACTRFKGEKVQGGIGETSKLGMGRVVDGGLLVSEGGTMIPPPEPSEDTSSEGGNQ